MQYIYQSSQGTRKPVSYEAYMVASHHFKGKISHIIRTKTLTIFCLAGNEKAWCESQSRRSNKMGGSDRMRNPYDYIK